MSEETRRHLKPVGTRPGIMYGSCKAHKKCVDGCSPFTPILSGLQKPAYKLAKYSVPILEPLTITNTQSKIRLTLPLILLNKISATSWEA